MKKIAFFDFDGTITKKDSFLEFVKYSKGQSSLVFGLFINAPWLLAYMLSLLSRKTVKGKLLKYFFGGMTLLDFQEACDRFSETILPSLIRSTALTRIQQLQKSGVTVVIVSASPENWIKKWADENRIYVIATRLNVRNKVITGNIAGRNCYGKEKVTQIRKYYNLNEFDEIYAFGDSKGDRHMLALAKFSFYKPFRH